MTMMGYWKLLTTLWFVFLLTGCATSLDDMQEMSGSERADFVCERRSDIEAKKRKVNEAIGSVKKIERAMELGYWERQACVDYKEKRQGWIHHRTHCFLVKDKPIIRPVAEALLSVEKTQLAEHRAAYRKLLADCRELVISMTPERALNYYKQDK